MLVRGKGVYRFEYMDSWEKFEGTKQPTKNECYSKLSMRGISYQDYDHAQHVWNRITPEFENFTSWNYHDVYLAKDVLFLVDVFETFRSTCLEHHKLDPEQFCAALCFGWQALLKTTSGFCEHVAKRKDCKLCLTEFRLQLVRCIVMHVVFGKVIMAGKFLESDKLHLFIFIMEL